MDIEKPAVSVLCFGTVTLLPKYYKETSVIQYEKTAIPLIKLLRSLNAEVSVVAEHTKSFNIHYHILIMFRDHRNCYKRFYDSFRKSKLFGYVNIKQVVDLNGVIEYCMKDIHTTYSCLNEPPVIVDDTGYFIPKTDFAKGIYLRTDLIDEQ